MDIIKNLLAGLFWLNLNINVDIENLHILTILLECNLFPNFIRQAVFRSTFPKISLSCHGNKLSSKILGSKLKIEEKIHIKAYFAHFV